MILSEFSGNKNIKTEIKPRFLKHYDVLVAGLGTAGDVAAVLLAKNNLSVLAIEPNEFTGGTSTAGNIIGYYHGGKGGYYQKLDENAVKFKNDGFINIKGTDCAANYAKIESICELHKKYGVTALYKTAVVGVFLEDKKVVGVRYANADGIFDISADYVIDCTGNGLVSMLAGCEMIGGREIDGRFQPYSNVQKTRVSTFVGIANIDSGYLNPYNGEEYGKAVLKSLLAKHWTNCRNQHKSLGNSILLGIREGKRIVGEKTVSLKSILDNPKGENTVFYAYSNIDNHGKDTAFENREAKDWATVCSLWGYLLRFPVPFEVFIPKGFDGILSAGRILSVEHNLASALRMRSDMARSGEVVAQMICIAKKEKCNVRDIPYEELRKRLLESGCLKETDSAEMVDDVRGFMTPVFPPIEKGDFWLKDIIEIKNQLSTDRPGHAIMSAVRGNFRKELREFLSRDNELLKRNSALALGLLCDETAEEELLKLAETKDGYIPQTSRKYNAMHAVSAISVLGKTASVKAIPLLLSILENKDYAKDIPFEASEFMQIKEEIYSQLFTHSFMSLLEIGEKHPEYRAKILKEMKSSIYDSCFKLYVTLKSGEQYTHDLLPKVKEIYESYLNKWQ